MQPQPSMFHRALYKSRYIVFGIILVIGLGLTVLAARQPFVFATGERFTTTIASSVLERSEHLRPRGPNYYSYYYRIVFAVPTDICATQLDNANNCLYETQVEEREYDTAGYKPADTNRPAHSYANRAEIKVAYAPQFTGQMTVIPPHDEEVAAYGTPLFVLAVTMFALITAVIPVYGRQVGPQPWTFPLPTRQLIALTIGGILLLLIGMVLAGFAQRTAWIIAGVMTLCFSAGLIVWWAYAKDKRIKAARRNSQQPYNRN